MRATLLTPRPYYVRGRRSEVCEVELISHKHPVYRSWVNEWRPHRMAPGELKDEVAADYGRRMRSWEVALRDVFRKAGADVCPDRYLAFRQRRYKVDRDWRRNCREIDVVLGSRESPDVFIEIKTRERAVDRAEGSYNQIKTSVAVASARWPSVRSAVVFVYVGSVLGVSSVAEDGVTFVPLADLSGCITKMEGCDPGKFWIDGRELFDFGVRWGHFCTKDLEVLAELNRGMRNSSRISDASSELAPGLCALEHALLASGVTSDGD